MRLTSPFQKQRLHLKADDIWVGRPKRLDVVGNWRKEADRDKEAFDGSSMALLGLHEWVYKETSYAPRLTLIKRILKERILQDTRINEDLPHKERPSPPRNECQLYTTIKTPKPSQTKVHIIYPNSGTKRICLFLNEILSLKKKSRNQTLIT